MGMVDTQAVIMAGGKGTRLAQVTGNIPKPMVPIAGRPLLEHQIQNLKDCGVTEIVLVIGYLGEVIRQYFGGGERFGVTITYYEEATPLGTAGALRELRDRLPEDFLLVFGDLYISMDFDRFYQYHKQKQAAITLFAHPNSHPYDSDILLTDIENRVTGWSAKNTVRKCDLPNLVNAGVYAVSRKALEGLLPQAKLDMERDVILPRLSSGRVYAYRSTEYVKDIGTPDRLRCVEEDVRNGICEKRNLRNRQKCIFLDRDGTLNRYVGFLTRSEQLELEDRSAEALRKINASEYLAIVITNQPVVARGECTFEQLGRIHARMETLLGEQGAYIDGLYFCPHHPDKGFDGEVPELKIKCHCRKPDIGLIEQAAREHNIDMKNSWMVGDTNVDVCTGQNAGLHTALLATGALDKQGKYRTNAELEAKDLLECVSKIFAKEEAQ